MVDTLFTFFDFLDDTIWTFLGFPAIILLGLLFSVRSRFFQIRRFPAIVGVFTGFIGKSDGERSGVHPLKVFFASVGGCIGIGNVVGVCTAVQVGGPGALFWLWVTGFLGMLLKYAEVHIGMQHRVTHSDGSYSGGPMYYLPKAFKGGWVAKVACGLLVVYGVEVYMFRVISESLASNLELPSYGVAAVLLPLVLVGGLGGVQRVGNICTAIIPFFVAIFSGMSLWVLFLHAAEVPAALWTVLRSAFTGHAAVGGFTGATTAMTISYGVRRACYTGDIGIGYASVIHSESSTNDYSKQASLAIFGIFLDTFIICTLSILLILVTGAWSEGIDATYVIQEVLSRYFPFMPLFMSLLIFLLGYSSMIAFLCVGRKAAEFLSPKHGARAFFVYATVALVLAMFVNTEQALTVMSVVGASLLAFNLTGIFLLRKQVEFPEGF